MEFDLCSDVDRLSAEGLSQSQSAYSSDEDPSSSSDSSQVIKLNIFIMSLVDLCCRATLIL